MRPGNHHLHHCQGLPEHCWPYHDTWHQFYWHQSFWPQGVHQALILSKRNQFSSHHLCILLRLLHIWIHHFNQCVVDTNFPGPSEIEKLRGNSRMGKTIRLNPKLGEVPLLNSSHQSTQAHGIWEICHYHYFQSWAGETQVRSSLSCIRCAGMIVELKLISPLFIFVTR